MKNTNKFENKLSRFILSIPEFIQVIAIILAPPIFIIFYFYPKVQGNNITKSLKLIAISVIAGIINFTVNRFIFK
jgi:hypothetical protein